MSQYTSRYHRQMLLPGFGGDGQERLGASTALILGCGALGSVAADMLARAGVGHLIIVDRDIIEMTNLQRQILFDEQDVKSGLPKSEAAKRKIGRINSEVKVSAIVDDINHRNIAEIAADADVFVDGLDNIETRYLANDLAVERGTPYVYGAAVGTTGMVFPVLPHGDGNSPWERSASGDLATPCFRCLFEEAPPPGTSATCDTVGVMNSLIGLVANFQVTETLKILTANFAAINRRLLTLDAWANEVTYLKVDKTYDESNCPCCKQRHFEYLDGLGGSTAVTLCGRNAVQMRRHAAQTNIDFTVLADRLRNHGAVVVNDFVLQSTILDGATPIEITLFRDGRAIIKGTDDTAAARGIYAKYIGN